MFAVNFQICKGTPRWSQRSYDVIFNHYIPAIILMLPEDGIKEYDPNSKDWRVALFANVVEKIQENDKLDFVPVIAHHDSLDHLAARYMWPLADFMKVENEDLPQIFFLHPDTHENVPYPVKMEKIEDFTPELILLWAQKEKAEIDVATVKEMIEEAKNSLNQKETVGEGGDEWLEHLQHDLFKYEYLAQNFGEDYEAAKKEL